MSTCRVVGGLWVRLGKIKCAAIWVSLCVGIAALLILRSVGIFSFFLSIFYCSVGLFTMTPNSNIHASTKFSSKYRKIFSRNPLWWNFYFISVVNWNFHLCFLNAYLKYPRQGFAKDEEELRKLFFCFLPEANE